MNRIFLSIIFTITFSALVFFLFIPVESFLLENIFDILSEIDQTLWLAKFREIAAYNLVISLTLTFVWIFCGYLFYQIKDWRNAGGREFWFLIGGLMLLFILILGFYFTDQTQDAGKYIATIFYALNGLFVFWSSSVCQSPATVKFAPIGAKQLRRLKLLRQILN